MLPTRLQIRRQLLSISNKLSLPSISLPHITSPERFPAYDAARSTPLPARATENTTKSNTNGFVPKLAARPKASKQQRALSTRERLGFPPIIRVEKNKTQSFASQYHPDWGTSSSRKNGKTSNPRKNGNQSPVEVEASSQTVLEGTPVTKTSEDSNLQESAAAVNLEDNNVLAGMRDAKLVFDEAWTKIEARYGKQNLSFPKEIIWLMGAPGSGKGTHTPFLLQARGITNPPINMSSLLTNVSPSISTDSPTRPIEAEGEVSSAEHPSDAGHANIISESSKDHTLEVESTSSASAIQVGTATDEEKSLETARELKELQEQINKGKMIPDGKVFEILLHALLDCDANVGVLVDGFPRTEVQVECLKLFYDKMHSIRREFSDTSISHRFPRPVFRICVLFVDEEISIQRQLARGRTTLGNNDLVRKTGRGQMMEERVTDYNESLIRARYKIFTEHYGALLKLAKIFPFHLINALGSIEDVMRMILKEFEYQSSLELDEETFEAIGHIPLAGKIGVHARQDLLRRLEEYQVSSTDLLNEAVEFVDDYVMPVVTRHAISGSALIRSEDVRLENQVFVDIIMDVLSERGYHVTFDARRHSLPVRIDRETFEVITRDHYIYVFKVRFPCHNIQPIEHKMIPQMFK